MRDQASSLVPAGLLSGRPASAPGAVARTLAKVHGSGWIFAYIGIQFAAQLALLLPAFADFRVLFRSAAFGASLLFLLLIPGWNQRSHSVRTLALVAMTILTLSAFNPDGGAPLAVFAQWALYLAILAPLFWVSRLELKERTLENLLLVIWAFHVVSSIFALLQVYFPGQFQPALTTFIAENQATTIRLASGEWVRRPMGLTDTPGAAAGSGLYATLLGFGIVVTRPFRGAPLLGIASMVLGMACLYLSQVRAVLVMLGICFIVIVALMAFSGRLPRLFWSLLIGAVVVLVGFEVAFDLGGATVSNRLESLIESDPSTVYRSNRGRMLEYAFTTLLPQYPLGAGLGHWGMMNAYFGSREHEIGAELQFNGWLLDGGAPLMVVYFTAIVLVTWQAMRSALRATGNRLEGWVTVVASYNVGTLALCFSYVPFMSTSGLEFWLLNAVLIQLGRSRAESALVPAT